MAKHAKHEIKLSEHPRARASIVATKAWSALVAFAVVGLLSWQAGAAPFDVGLRALVAGVVAYVLAWAVAVQVWRHLAVAEVKARVQERERLLLERQEQIESENTMIVREGA
jgi:hypothetical protein